MLDYDMANMATDTEVHELLEKAHAFRAARGAVDGAFDARVGGGYRMSLFYPSSEQVYRGKTSEREDHFTARFVELTPSTRIVQAISFDSVDPAFSGEMTMVVTFEERDGGTAVTIVFEHIPSGIRPEDNEAGCRSSLEKLARYLE
jgi:uncharacterized protein YndB with AHSA1/START domain